MTQMPYSTFLIDLDHTLFDSDASELAAFSRTLGIAGVQPDDGQVEAFRRINLELWRQVELGQMIPQQVKLRRFERLVEELALDADAGAMAEAYVAGLANNGELYPGALEVLEALAESASLALVTNGLGEVQRARIERTGIRSYFDAIVISAEVGTAKPAQDIFNIAFDQLGAPQKETAVMVGDNLASDIRGGTNYGISTCWYNPRRRQPGPDDRITHEIHALDGLLALS
ncbi:MAG: YjjG family noncanonical pyrimidine nucleotidase [Woeseia sp.]